VKGPYAYSENCLYFFAQIWRVFSVDHSRDISIVPWPMSTLYSNFLMILHCPFLASHLCTFWSDSSVTMCSV